MRAEGRLADDDAEPPGAALLTAALGSDDRPEADFSQKPRRLKFGDRLLICSDGLCGVLSESELRKDLSRGTPSAAAKRLIRAALEAGGPDNVTVIVASWEPEQYD